ncbi:MAG: hypothetical protein ACREV6_21330 [Clostridium sp.]|uniref:hypothetical protein n=1 Tax=Clostridium sp. TaxID=1506 RepID=UPI003D6CF8A3
MKSKKLLIIIATITLASGLISCRSAGIKDNKVYEVNETSKSKDIKKISESINTQGVDSFKDNAKMTNSNITSSENILLTISKDEKYSYFMTPIKEAKDSQRFIKGASIVTVNLLKIDNKTKEMKVLASEIPFISTVKWNSDKTVVAFCGGERLCIYDTKVNKLMLSDELKKEPITYFGFSPDGRKVYTEHPSIINGSIIYIDSSKIVHSYEKKENLYYKGILDSNYYYATKTEDSNGKSSITIVDKKESVVKDLPLGRFRDSYRKALLKTGKENFGLFYIKDINEEEQFKKITDEYVLDVKFIEHGKFIYTTEIKDVEKNSFYLHLVNENGEEEKKIEISSGVISLLPDGEKAYVGGYKQEVINLKAFHIEKSVNHETGEEENVFKALRGAMDVLYKYEINDLKDFEGLKKYFLDTKNPDQWAYFDITNILKESQRNTLSGANHKTSLYLDNFKLYDNDTKATAKVKALVQSYSGSGLSMDNSVELNKVDNKWYITGFSTFPNSKEYKTVKTKVESLINLIKSGNLTLQNNIHSELAGKNIEIGQIQFWQMSDPHLASNVEYSNHCKVYLKVVDNNKEVIYKMLLTKAGENKWMLDTITKDRLSSLY